MVERGSSSADLPPGFRFHPTDEELIMFYLRNQATSRPCPVSIIPEVDIYKFDPWQLPEKAEFGEHEWYFFSPRDRKYPNGVRPNRAAVSGYWKATGTDKAIYSGAKYVGVKKALVFYKGKPPKGMKTDWIMHEYRLSDSSKSQTKRNGSMRLDDWVLCRIYKKKNIGRVLEQTVENSTAQSGTTSETNDSQLMKLPRPCSLSQMWELDSLGSLPQLLNDNTYDSYIDNYQITFDKFQLGEFPHQYMNSLKFQGSHSSGANQPIFLNSMYQFQ
ncbi:hypothetical protein NMG60_11036247 [Bertholletia excelsa]